MVVLHIFNLTYLKGLKLDFLKKNGKIYFGLKKLMWHQPRILFFLNIRKLEKGSGDRFVGLQKISRPCWDQSGTETLSHPETTDTRAKIRIFATAGAF